MDDEKIIERYKPKRIVTTGHSLGAATSSVLHLLLANDQKNQPSCDLQKVFQHDSDPKLVNVAFATPMFGNMGLKNFVAKDPRFGNMYHFVDSGDIVPSVLFISHVYHQNLSFSVKLALNLSYENLKTVIIRLLSPFIASENLAQMEEDETQKVLRKVHEEILKNIENEPGTLVQNTPGAYIPIGKYLYIMNKGNAKTLHEFPNDHQWVSETLMKSLVILEDFAVFNEVAQYLLKYAGSAATAAGTYAAAGPTGATAVVLGGLATADLATLKNWVPQSKRDELIKAILQNHNMESYRNKITNTLTCGAHNDLMQWVIMMDRINDQRR